MAIPVVPTEIIEQASRLSPPPPVQRFAIVDDVCVIVILGVCAIGAICYANSKPIKCNIGSGGFSRGGGWSRPDCWLLWLGEMALIDLEYAEDITQDILNGSNDANSNYAHRAAGAAIRYANCIAGGGSGRPGGGPLPGRPRGIGNSFEA